MSDVLTLFKKDDSGRLTSGIYKWVGLLYIADWYEVGWAFVPRTDDRTCHHDHNGVLMTWPNVRRMRIPDRPIIMGMRG